MFGSIFESFVGHIGMVAELEQQGTTRASTSKSASHHPYLKSLLELGDIAFEKVSHSFSLQYVYAHFRQVLDRRAFGRQ